MARGRALLRCCPLVLLGLLARAATTTTRPRAFITPISPNVWRRPQAPSRRDSHVVSMVKTTPKIVYLQDQSCQKLIKGINTVADCVKVTLGPRGKNVVLWRDVGYPEVVNDGVTIARDIVLADPAENVGAKLIKSVAVQSDRTAGDGTTTSTLMTQVLINRGYRLIQTGFKAMALWRGMKKASDYLLEKMKTLSRPVQSSEDLHNIATIASGSETMGAFIAKAFERVGPNGHVVIEESPTMFDQLDFTEGMNFDIGYCNPGFMTDDSRKVAELDKPYILLTNHPLENIRDLVELLENFASSERQLLIIAEEIKGAALDALLMNKERGSLKVAAMKCPGFGMYRQDYYTDIATATGATFVAKETGMSLEKVTMDMLGSATKAILRAETTTLVLDGKNKEAIDRRIAVIRRDAEESDSAFDKDKGNERIASLGGGIARIRVGAPTEVELKDKKLRYEDAVNSVKSGLKYGVLPGGGTTLLYLKRYRDEVKDYILKENPNSGDDEIYGANILLDALGEPMRQIAQNAGLHGPYVVSRCEGKEFGYGFNAATMTYGSMFDTGVLDSVAVVENSLRNSVSIASLVLTTGGMIVEDSEELARMEAAAARDEAESSAAKGMGY